MREEYTRENYPSFGKKYAGEKAIISLTSWKARIDTVSKTLYSLIKQCPGFHIVLVLSEEEFPKMMDNLPSNLKLFVKNNLIEVLWVYKNYKSFKKVFFTMDKYREVPVISADDDCIYTCNYARTLYNEWAKNKSCCVSNKVFNKHGYIWTQGASTLYAPYRFGKNAIKNKDLVFILNSSNDDAFIGALYKKLGISCKQAPFKSIPFYFHDNHEALSPKSDGNGYDAKSELNNFYRNIVL